MLTIDYRNSKYIKKAFEFADATNKGYLTSNEYKISIVALFGQKPLKGEKDIIFGYDRSRKLTMKEFSDIIHNKVKQNDREQHIHDAFLLMDCKSKGFLVLEDLKEAQKNAFPHISPRVIEKAFAAGDANKDGRISYREFHNIMSYGFTHLS